MNRNFTKSNADYKKYQNLYDSAPEMFRTINLDGVILDCNKQYCVQLGYTKKEVIGKSIFDFVPKDGTEIMQDAFKTWKTTGNVSNKDILLKRKDGNVFPALISATNFYGDDGKLIGSNTIIRDISEIRSAQNELEELRIKRLIVIGELTSRVAHDIRNPLSVIKNSVELLQSRLDRETLSATGPQWDRLNRAIYRLSHQVEDVLDFIRTPILNKDKHSLSLILHNVMERIQIPDTINMKLPSIDATVYCDQEKLEVVFVNLIMNSIQAMEGKQNQIVIKILEKDSDNFVHIEIKDTGKEIPPEMLPKIFEPLFTTKQMGTGLGLPSCKNIIEQHGGTIGVKNTTNKGTAFLIKLPKNQESSKI